jgi:hypothetical protein
MEFDRRRGVSRLGPAAVASPAAAVSPEAGLTVPGDDGDPATRRQGLITPAGSNRQDLR